MVRLAMLSRFVGLPLRPARIYPLAGWPRNFQSARRISRSSALTSSLAPEPLIAVKQPIATHKTCASGIAATVACEVIRRQLENVFFWRGLWFDRLGKNLNRLRPSRRDGFCRNWLKKQGKTFWVCGKSYSEALHRPLEAATIHASIGSST